eukprot:3867643-Amphidinium_carterae.1
MPKRSHDRDAASTCRGSTQGRSRDHISVAQGKSHGLEQSADDDEDQQCRQWHRVAVTESGDNLALVSDNAVGNATSFAQPQQCEWIKQFIGHNFGRSL